MSGDSRNVQYPKWDGKASTCPRYLDHVESLAVFHDCGDAFDKTTMANCPKKSEFDILMGQSTKTDDDKEKINLYKQNRRMCAILKLGQESDHGLAIVKKSVSVDHPNGLAWKIVQHLMDKYRPNDVAARIQMTNALKKLKFGDANKYYNDVVGVCAKFNVVKSETDLIEIMADAVTDSVYSQMVLRHLESSDADDLEQLCLEMSKLQRITKTSEQVPEDKKQKEVQLATTDGNSNSGGSFNGICRNCNKKGHKKAQCPEKKSKSYKNDGDSKECAGCGRKGHSESHCWKKHPEKAPKWFKDGSKSESASGVNVEVCLSQLDVTGQDFA